jgi:amylosucrase
MPMLFYGDELGYINDYSYLGERGKTYDNRWMHRPYMHPEKLKRLDEKGSPEERIFSGTKRLLQIRKKLSVLADTGNLTWLNPQNIHVASFIRRNENGILYGLFNFSGKKSYVSWYLFKQAGDHIGRLHDHWMDQDYIIGEDHEYFTLEPYSFCLMESY